MRILNLTSRTSLAAGVLLLLATASWTWLSREFVFGQGHASRPILAFLLLYLIAWLAFILGLIELLKNGRRMSLRFILFVALGARLLLLPSHLIQENDPYRYLLDGQVLLHGENPYRLSPLVVAELGSAELRESLAAPQARTALERIGYPEVPTVYPPVAQLAFAAGALLTGWDWLGQRIVFLAIDVLVIAALILLLRMLSLSTGWVLLYAWNPLVLKEVGNSAHLDVLVALFVILTLMGLRKVERTRNSVWVAFAGLALGLAVLSKLYPLILCISACLFLSRLKVGLPRLVTFFGLTLTTIVMGYVPFLTVGPEKLTAGLSTYAGEWKMNDGAFAILSWISSDPRLWSGAIVLAAALAVPLLRKSRTTLEVAGDFQWVLLWWFLFLPSPFPWYAVPLVALAAVRPERPPTLALILLSGVGGLYYLSFLYEYRGYGTVWWDLTRAFEHSVVWLALLLTWLRKSPRKKS